MPPPRCERSAMIHSKYTEDSQDSASILPDRGRTTHPHRFEPHAQYLFLVRILVGHRTLLRVKGRFGALTTRSLTGATLSMRPRQELLQRLRDHGRQRAPRRGGMRTDPRDERHRQFDGEHRGRGYRNMPGPAAALHVAVRLPGEQPNRLASSRAASAAHTPWSSRSAAAGAQPEQT